MQRTPLRILAVSTLALAAAAGNWSGTGSAATPRHPTAAPHRALGATADESTLTKLGTRQAGPDARSANLELNGRSPKRNTVGSDQAFWGNLAFEGNYNGFRIINIKNPSRPEVVSDVDCRGPQNDVTVWGNLLFLSIDRPQTTDSCDNSTDVQIDPKDPSTWTGFEGIRIIDVSNPRDPVFVKGVETDCGSHTATLVPDLKNGRVLLYVSSYPLIPGPHCGPGKEADPRHGKISVVAVPLKAPQQARVVSTPRVNPPVLDFGDPFFPAVGCHDIGVFLPLKIAAAACMTEGQFWDISDPAHPKTMGGIRLRNQNFGFWHSATFTYDGRVVVFGDETEEFPCAAPASKHGRLWFYRVADGKLLGSFNIPRAQPDQYCSAHEFTVIPVRDRYLLTSSWYEGGTTVVDFTNPAKAREIAFFDARQPLPSVAWSSYWYNGRIYVNDIIRGLDVLGFDSPVTEQARRFPYLNSATQTVLLR